MIKYGGVRVRNMNDFQYTSPYIKSEYSGIIRVRNSLTGKMEERQVKRFVYRSSKIDPDLIIPAGTKLGKEITKKDETNLERMQSGKSPVIQRQGENGIVTYDKIELHHLTSEEQQRGSQFFSGERRDGTLVEIAGSVHDKYKKQLHAINEPNNSFRKLRVETESEDGQTVRNKVKSHDATQYEKFRSQYWKNRAYEITQQRQSKESEQKTNLEHNEGEIKMSKSWELTPEEKKRAMQYKRPNNADKWSKKTTSTSDEGKGERERVRTRTKRDKGQSR